MSNEPASSAAVAPFTTARGTAIADPRDVDDALANELAEAFTRWGRWQGVGLVGLMGAVALACTVSGATGFFALVAFFPAMIVGNTLADRAAVKEWVALGLHPQLARLLMRRTYSVPEAYTALGHALSNKPASRAAMARIIRRALEKC